jgi:hypothetical protein
MTGIIDRQAALQAHLHVNPSFVNDEDDECVSLSLSRTCCSSICSCVSSRALPTCRRGSSKMVQVPIRWICSVFDGNGSPPHPTGVLRVVETRLHWSVHMDSSSSLPTADSWRCAVAGRIGVLRAAVWECQDPTSCCSL